MAKILKRIKAYPPIACNQYTLGLITKFYGNGHSGIDSCTIAGLDVCAICDSVVKDVYWSSTHGNCLEYGYDGVTIKYCHMAKISVTKGQKLSKNQVVGQMGSTGSLTNQLHLHLSLYINNTLVDPLPYLDGRKGLPTETKTIDTKGGDNMRKVISPLNLRSGAGTNHSLVYKNMPVGTLFVTGTKSQIVKGASWGQAIASIGGKSYTGWVNLGSTWSVEV